MTYIEKYVFYNLDINQVAMRIHSTMKTLQGIDEYRSIITLIEKSKMDTSEYDNEIRMTQRYTLLIIASKYELRKDDIIKILRKLPQVDIGRS